MAGELILRRKGTQFPLYLGAVGQAVVPEAGLILLLFFFISFSFPFHLAAAPCETGSLLQCFTDASPLGSNAKDLCVKTGHFPIIIPFEPMLLSKKVDVSVL